MSPSRDEAEALAVGLELGVCSIVDVVAWADAQLLREDAPPSVLCDVSLAGGRYPQDVAGLLRQVPGQACRPNIDRLLIVLMYHQLRRHSACAGPIAWALRELDFSHRIEDPQLSEFAFYLGHKAYLAEEGYGLENEVFQTMADVLEQAAERSGVTWSAVFGGGGSDDSPSQ